MLFTHFLRHKNVEEEEPRERRLEKALAEVQVSQLSLFCSLDGQTFITNQFLSETQKNQCVAMTCFSPQK